LAGLGNEVGVVIGDFGRREIQTHASDDDTFDRRRTSVISA